MPDLLKRRLTLVLENCDMDAEQLSELFADALDGSFGG